MNNGLTNGVERGAALKAARVSAGLTQQQLADLAELSIRTIRALETGISVAPHQNSLLRIAATLGMNSADRLSFLQSWGHNGAVRTDQLDAIYVGKPDASLIREALRRRVASTETLVNMVKTQVGRNRRLLWRDADTVLLARLDGVTGATHMTEAVSEVELDLLEVTNLRSCQLLSQRSVAPFRIRMFELDFGRSLSRGQSHAYSYRVDYRSATQVREAHRSQVSRPASDHAGDGSYRSVPLYSFQVQFDPDDPPIRCVQIFRARPEVQVVELDEVALTAWSAAQLTIQDARPGFHGLRWYW